MKFEFMSAIAKTANRFKSVLWKSLGFLLVFSVYVFNVNAADNVVAFNNQIQNIEYTTLPNGRVDVHLKLKNAMVAIPPSFTLTSPPRIVFDVPQTSNGLGKNNVSVNQGPLKNILLAQTNDRSRLVLNLTKNVPHQVSLQKNDIIISLQAEEVAGNPVTESKFSEAKVANAKHQITNVDFIRGKNGEGRIVVDLSDTNSAINIKNTGKTIVVNFEDTQIPEKLQRRLNVVNFNTPVLFVDTFKRTDSTQIVIEPKGDWEQSAYQAEKRFIIDVRPIVYDANKLVQNGRQGYSGEKLSLNFQKVEVRDVLKAIADFTGKNIIASDSVTGNITIGLKDVPWDEALDVIMKAKGLDMRQNGSVISIAPAEELAAKEKALQTSRQELENVETLRTEVFTLKYMKATDLKTLLVGQGSTPTGTASSGSTANSNRILSPRGSVTFDARSNTVFIQDTAKKLDEVQAIINKVDIAVKQVMIESRMVLADNKFSKQLGARFGVTSTATGNNSATVSGTLGNRFTASSTSGLTQGTHNGSIQTVTNNGSILTSSDGAPDLMSNLPVTNAYGNLALSILKLSANTLVNLELSAMESDARGKIVSSPRVTTANQQKARIAQGVEIPYQQATSSGATATAFKKAELSLEVTPQITPDKKIIMDLDVRKDSQGATTVGGVAINTQNVQTQVIVGNGETIVLGGIYEQTSRNDVDKVPFFGDLPIVGNAFKRTSKTDNKTELLIFITPKIMEESLNLN